ncbi:hypothetical protein IIB34_00165 [PVC group bacterium]|nr:hypothetical protein [PVC group bacterium]
MTLPNRSAWILPIEQALTDQIHIVYSTAEITKVQKKGKNTVLSLRAPRDAQSMMKFRFQKIPRRFLVDGKKPKKISVKGRVVEITFVVNHPAHKAELTIVS